MGLLASGGCMWPICTCVKGATGAAQVHAALFAFAHACTNLETALLHSRPWLERLETSELLYNWFQNIYIIQLGVAFSHTIRLSRHIKFNIIFKGEVFLECIFNVCIESFFHLIQLKMHFVWKDIQNIYCKDEMDMIYWLSIILCFTELLNYLLLVGQYTSK